MKTLLTITFVAIISLFCFSSTYAVENIFFKGKTDNIDPSLYNNDANFEWGIRDELIIMYTNIYDHETNVVGNILKLSLPHNLHLLGGIEFLKYYKVELRFGLTFLNEDFGGFDAGAFLKANLFNSDFNLSLGLDFFNNQKTSHNLSSSGGDFIFYCFGLGYDFSQSFSADVIYYIPNKKVYGYDINTGYSPTGQIYEKVNKGLVKIGFQYSFIF